VEPDALAALYPVHDVPSFQRWIDFLKPYQNANPELMRPVLQAQIESLIAQNVVYAELMLSPTMFAGERSALLKAFHQWREWTFEMEKTAIQVEFLLAIPRTLSPEALERDTALCIELKRENLIVGVALVGMESGASIRRFAGSLRRCRDAGLGIELHAGEHAGPECVWEALEHGVPHRLGHAISAFQDSSLLERLQSTGIHIEFCPTSNLRTGAVSDMTHHPIEVAKKLGLNFSINTDDPGAFDCSMTTEYRHAVENFGFTSEDFRQVFRDSLAARFTPKLRYLPAQ
jgi:adenosine deaminase